MKKIILSICLLMVAGCSPRDGQHENARLEATGYRSTTCFEETPDKTNLYNSEDFDQQIYLGDITAIMEPGDRNCYRIGSLINLQNLTKNNTTAAVRGKLKVLRVDILHKSNLRSEHRKALGIRDKEAMDALVESKMTLAKDVFGFDPEGKVNITFFKYVKGTAPAGLDTGNISLTKDGERLSTCFKDEDSTNIYSWPTSNDKKIIKGDIKAVMSVGTLNCLRVGSQVNLQNKSKKNPNAPVRARLDVTRVDLVSKNKVTEEHAKALGITLDKLKEKVADELKRINDNCAKITKGPCFKHKDMVNFSFVKYVEGSAKEVNLNITLDKEGERAETCRSSLPDFDYLYVWPLEKDADIISGKVKALLSPGTRNCYRIGKVIAIQNKSKKTPDAPIRGYVKVKKVEIHNISQLKEAQAKAMATTLPELKAYAQAELDRVTFAHEDHVNVTYFVAVDKEGNPLNGDEDEGEEFLMPPTPETKGQCFTLWGTIQDVKNKAFKQKLIELYQSSCIEFVDAGEKKKAEKLVPKVPVEVVDEGEIPGANR